MTKDTKQALIYAYEYAVIALKAGDISRFSQTYKILKAVKSSASSVARGLTDHMTKQVVGYSKKQVAYACVLRFWYHWETMNLETGLPPREVRKASRVLEKWLKKRKKNESGLVNVFKQLEKDANFYYNGDGI